MDKKQIITASLVYIEKNLKRKISVAEIAGYAGYSKFYFSRMFKSEMNISVMEYVKERKIVCASESILRGDKILDVAISIFMPVARKLKNEKVINELNNLLMKYLM